MTAPNRLDAAAEQALVEQCRKQNFEAFGRIVDAYQTRILGFVRRMVPNPDEAMDITQDVFVRAYQGFARFDGRSSLRTWLFRIAHNLCVDRARKLDRSLPESRLDNADEDGEAYEVSDDRWNPESIALDEELVHVVEEGVRTMSDKLRTVLLLHDQEDLSYEDIAEMVKVPVGTVKSRLFLARAHLQHHVRSYWQGGSNHES